MPKTQINTQKERTPIQERWPHLLKTLNPGGGVHNKSCEIERCTSGAGSRDPHDSPGFSKNVSRAALHEYH
jgi:hypothetical protein